MLVQKMVHLNKNVDFDWIKNHLSLNKTKNGDLVPEVPFASPPPGMFIQTVV